uniref:Uncharacterized protein n=1 Tax=Lepeophtheirus salmonis TaxID=72036 RepID=A0A0K2UI45_LEPSM
MHPNMIHKFIFGLKGSSLPRAVIPIASVICNLWTTHMFHRDMCDNVMHGEERARAGSAFQRLWIDPHTSDFFHEIGRSSHVAEGLSMKVVEVRRIWWGVSPGGWRREEWVRRSGVGICTIVCRRLYSSIQEIR